MNIMDNINTLIIPDVHGRTFWKDALNKYNQKDYPNLDIVFLGDYLDPYSGYEDITPAEAYDRFLEIIEISKKDKRIILLLGNHDWHYLYDTDYCRLDRARSRQIEQIFKDNIQLFRFAYEKEINNKKYLFTHAGVLNGWLKFNKDWAIQELEMWPDGDEKEYQIENHYKERKDAFIRLANFDNDKDSLADLLNGMLDIHDDVITNPIGQISRIRGGWHWDGSPIWADVHEHLNNPFSSSKKYYQIFGHTWSYPDLDEGYVGEFFAMLDSRCAWKIDNENNISKI